MKILKTIRAGSKAFNPGQESELVEHSEVYPEQLDFFRLLKSGCIDEIPATRTLSQEERDKAVRQAEIEEAEKIRAANEEAERVKSEAAMKISEANAKAELRRKKSAADKAREVRINADIQPEGAGEGAE